MAPDVTADFHAKSFHRFASHAKDSNRGVTIPSDCRHLQSKPCTYQNKSNTLAMASRTHVGGDISRSNDRSQYVGIPHMNVNDRTEFCSAETKKSDRIRSGGAVSSAIGMQSCLEVPKMLPAYGNTKDIEMYATLPRKTRQLETVLQYRQDVGDVPLQTSHSGISHTSGIPHTSGNISMSTDDHLYAEMSRPMRQHDKTFPPHGSLPRLKISWLVTKFAFICVTVA